MWISLTAKEIDCDQEDLAWSSKLHSDSELAKLVLHAQSRSVRYLDLGLPSGLSCSQLVSSGCSNYTKIEWSKKSIKKKSF